jgi:hypothetical protein
MSVRQKIELARLVSAKLQQNLDSLPEPPFPNGALEEATSELQLAYNDALVARLESLEKTARQNKVEDALDFLLVHICLYLDRISDGEADLLEWQAT